MKKKVLFLINSISDYRVATYNLIAEQFDFTMGYTQSDRTKHECKFKKIQIQEHSVRGLHFAGRSLYKLCTQYDVVIIAPDLHNVHFCMLPFLPRKFKVINWSIGIRGHYDVARKHTFTDRLFGGVLKRCDASIVYMDKVREFWGDKIPSEKIFVARNTVPVIPFQVAPEQKKHFIFVGSLAKRKGLDKLLVAYNDILQKNADCRAELHIIGKGEEQGNIEKYIEENRLEGKVFLHGAIYDEEELACWYAKALLCISPTQAGLSVVKSMGYGVPFVTKADSITGGELYHIHPNVDGFVYKSDDELFQIMDSAIKNPNPIIEMGLRAQHYYYEHATVERMAQGAIDAILYALGKTK